MRALSLAPAVLLIATAGAAGPPRQMHYDRAEKLAYLPVSVNGSRTYRFVLDTGAPHTVIDSSVASELKLSTVSNGKVTGAAHGSVPMRHGADADIAVGSARLKIHDPWIIDLNASHLSARRLDGLIGAEFFAAYVIRIDPEKQTIAFLPPDTPYRGNGARVPLSFVDNRLFLDVTLAIAGRKPVVHRVRIDTGSNDAVSDDLVKQSPERRKSLQGVGLGTPYVDYSGVLDRVEIGPYTIRQAWGPSNDKPMVGMEILRRFTMTFDAAHGSLYLEPNRHFGEPVPAPAP